MKYQLTIIVENTLLYIGLSLSFWGCTNAQKKLAVIPLPSRTYIDTSSYRGKQDSSRIVYYIVQGYKNNNATEKYLDNFVHNMGDTNFSKYGRYEVVLYKQSKQTNVKNINAFPRIVDRYSQEHDWIYSYKWSYGQLISKWKIKKGEIIKPKQTIKLEDIP